MALLTSRFLAQPLIGRCSLVRVVHPASVCPAMKRSADEELTVQQAHVTVVKRRRKSVVTLAAPRSASPAKAATTSQTSPGGSHEQGTGLWLVVGLGNPGANYERTRHNVGFMVIDELARTHDIDCRKLEKSAAVGKGTIEGKQVLLVKPMTFMNNSGEAVAALARFYKVPTQRILVVSDDLDIPHAALRMRAKGGHGGHNGLRSISERMGNTQDYPRIKVGIGRPAGPIPIATWVLQDFTRKEMEDMQITIQEACDLVRSVMSQGLERALSGVKAKESNGAAKESKPKPSAQGGSTPGGAGGLQAAKGAVQQAQPQQAQQQQQLRVPVSSAAGAGR